MPKALSLDLRQRAFALAGEGLPTLQIARQLRVSPAWVRRQKQRRREGKPIEPGVAPGRTPRLDASARATLIGWVDRQPDITLAQLQTRCREELGLLVSIGTVWNTLRIARLTFKKSRSTPANNSAPTSRPRGRSS